MYSIPGSCMSSMKVPLPRMRRPSSLRLTLWPIPRISVASVLMWVGSLRYALAAAVCAATAFVFAAAWIAFTMFM